jgi:hypothetical protein
MSTITLSEAKTLVGDRDCHIGDFLYMDLDVALPTSLGNVIGIGAKWKAQNAMPKPKQLQQTSHSITTSYFVSCPVRPSAGNSPRRKNPAVPAVEREAEEDCRGGWR